MRLLHLLVPGISSGSAYGSGGQIGAWTGILLEQKFSVAGIMIFAGSLLTAGVLLTPLSDALQPVLHAAALPASAIRATSGWFQRVPATVIPRKESSKATQRDTVGSLPTIPFKVAAVSAEVDFAEVEGRSIRINPPASLALHNPDGLVVAQRRGFSLPDINLLLESEEFPYEELAKKARVAATTLENAFEEFGLNVKVAEIDTGPVMTQFELELERGLRLNRNHSVGRRPCDRIACSLRTRRRTDSREEHRRCRSSERKAGHGPNAGADCRPARESSERCVLPMFLGKDVSGRPLAVDMAKMPHLLIAGRQAPARACV